MSKKNHVYFVSVFLMFTFTEVFAYKIPPLPGDTAPPVGLPIDGGISFLIVSGIFLGIYSLRKRK